ncbi:MULTISPECIES: NACHT domain-containing protein [unclassified Streptomyces]|uniref:NACHT domain-containing protein n=1 Tax=unclassified Streptomyces TaxID=2593676 RepID=UPI00336AB720
MDEPELASAELASRLRRLRTEHGLTVMALQRRSGLGRTTVSQALNGRGIPSEATVVALAKTLRADVDELLRLRSRMSSAATSPDPELDDEDADFERRYRDYVVGRYRQLTVVGLDLGRPEGACWPLDTAYLSLEMAVPDASPDWPREGAPAVRVERAEQALAGQRRTLVRGLAGSGKTTLLHWLAVGAARRDLPPEIADLRELIPFVLPLRTLIRQAALPAPDRFLETTGCMFAGAQPPGWPDRVLTTGRGLLLIDGIDEVPQQQRDRTREWLRELLAAYPRCGYVVTTRPSAVPEGWLTSLEFRELTVRPMRRRDVSVFISRWHVAARSELAHGPERKAMDALEEGLKDAVRAQRNLAQLATTPLMCALMCALHRDRRGHLPQGRMELYEAALSMLLIRRDRERDIGAPEGVSLTRQQSVQLLQRLAYWLIRNGQTEMDQDTALAVIEDLLPAMPAVAAQGDAARILTHLLSRSGLLRQPTADTIDFVHRTFQDYLGAKAAVEARDLPLLVRHAHDTQWEDVIRMAVGHAYPDVRATLLRRLIARGDKVFRHRIRLHLLATACLEQATELDPAVRQEAESRVAALLPPRSHAEANTLAAVGPVILDLLPGPEGLADDEAKAVVTTAAAVGGDAALTLLKKYRLHAAPEVRHALMVAWHSFDADEYVEEIINHLPDPDPLVIVSSRAELEALPKLRRRSDVRVIGDFTVAEIMSAIDREQLSSLDLSVNAEIDDLGFLTSLPRLRSLELFHCAIEDYSQVAGLPLTGLSLYDDDIDGVDLRTSSLCPGSGGSVSGCPWRMRMSGASPTSRCAGSMSAPPTRPCRSPASASTRTSGFSGRGWNRSRDRRPPRWAHSPG